MTADGATALDGLPSLDRLLRAPSLAKLLERHGRSRITRLLRARLQAVREAAAAGGMAPDALALAAGETALAEAVEAAIRDEDAMRLRPVFNLTGTVLHTNLGRAPLPEAAVAAVAAATAVAPATARAAANARAAAATAADPAPQTPAKPIRATPSAPAALDAPGWRRRGREPAGGRRAGLPWALSGPGRSARSHQVPRQAGRRIGQGVQ